MRIPTNLLIPVFLGSGTLHFRKPEPFDSIVPPQLPGPARAYTTVSGAAELAAATLLAAPALGPSGNKHHRRRSKRMRKFGGLFSAALLAAVWPANFYMAWQWRGKSLPKRAAAIARLPLQVPMIKAAWRAWKGKA